MKNQKGFSLIELLVVVIIIGIIAAIAVPSLLASRRAANEASAIANLRTVNTAEQTYLATTGNTTQYGTLAALSGAGLLDASWTGSPVKSNYTFAASLPTGNAGFCVTATSAGASTGSKSYATSHQGTIWYLAGTTAPACDNVTGLSSDGTVIN